MNKTFRYYNQNRYEIIAIIILIVLGIIILQLVNYGVSNNNKKKYDELKNTVREEANLKEETTYSITSGTQKQDAKNEIDIIKKFIDYCNNADIENAYSLLSEDCKKELFSTQDEFTNIYWKDKFKTTKICRLENWIGSTYKVYLGENMLSTGRKNVEEIQDYITVVKEDSQNKLNINDYIGNQKVKGRATNNDISIELLEKDTYMDYEIYTIRVENNGAEDVLLDNCKEGDTIYLTDNNNVKHVACMHELAPILLQVKPKRQNEIRIKFTNSYISNRSISSITFSNIILNEDNTINISIDL